MIINQVEKNEILFIINQLEQLPQTSAVINVLNRGKKLLGTEFDNSIQVTRLTEVMPVTRAFGM